MRPWEVWDCSFPWGGHPAVIISNAMRVELKPQIVVLSCRTMRRPSARDPVGCEVLLDEADGMDWKTLCRCDLMFTIDKELKCMKLYFVVVGIILLTCLIKLDAQTQPLERQSNGLQQL